MKKIFTIVIMALVLFFGNEALVSTASENEEEATVQTTNTLKLLWKIDDLDKTDYIELGLMTEEQTIHYPIFVLDYEGKPHDVSNEEMDLLARLVHAEAKGEPFVGKVAVATVVLNRVEHDEFPNTINDVIYQKNAFQPVRNGSIHEQADEEAIAAVEEALKSEGNEEENYLFFYNPQTATSNWILTRKVIKTIGNHAFAI